MKYIELDDPYEIPGTEINDNSCFSFDCNPGISCFNQCCHNLNLFLYPYDIIRLKHHLGISSDIFLEKYVDVVLRDSSFFPEVLLSMAELPDKPCPFLSPAGCSVYMDRPEACRMFPVEQGVVYHADSGKFIISGRRLSAGAPNRPDNGRQPHGYRIRRLKIIIK